MAGSPPSEFPSTEIFCVPNWGGNASLGDEAREEMSWVVEGGLHLIEVNRKSMGKVN